MVDGERGAASTGASLEASISAVRAGIAAACGRAGRLAEEVVLVAATKGVPIDLIRQARASGLDQFAENYATELAAKAPQVEARWHFIGKLQRGTAARIAAHADLVHSAEPGHALERLANRAASRGVTIPCLVQVDFATTRQGVDPDGVDGFVRKAARLDGIAIVGLMTLPPLTGDPEASRPYFARLRELLDRLRKRRPGLRELSMGMSGDYEVAVEEGATMVRVGTALFGPRSAGPTDD
jgi:pyridoxal phosphate enzyme (YggS family)